MFAARQTPGHAGDALARLTWQDFEHLLAEHYREDGYVVEHHTPIASLADLSSGLDLRLRRGSETVIVQCKHWDAEEVQLPDINQLLGNMLNEAATKGVFITRGRYSSGAKALMRRQPRLQLIDGDILRMMLRLPDHLDPSPVGARSSKAEKAARRGNATKAEATRGKPRRRGPELSSFLGPALLVLAIGALLGFFVWRTVTRHDDPVAATPIDDSSTSSAAAAAAPSPMVVPPTAAAPSVNTTPDSVPPLSGASGIVSKHGSIDPPSASHELAERERLRQQSDDARNARKHEDGMKVLEQSTRELGSHE